MSKRQQTTPQPISKLATEYSLKQATGKWYLKWRGGYRIVHIECNRHYPHIENQATGKTRPCSVKDVVYEPPVELWNVDPIFGRAGKFIYHPTNLSTISLNTT